MVFYIAGQLFQKCLRSCSSEQWTDFWALITELLQWSNRQIMNTLWLIWTCILVLFHVLEVLQSGQFRALGYKETTDQLTSYRTIEQNRKTNIYKCGVKYANPIVIINNVTIYSPYPEWPHRQCVGLALRRSHVRGWLSATSLVIYSPARIAVCNTWSSGGTALCRVGGATTQLDLPSLTPLSIACCGWLRLGAPRWATSVKLLQVVDNWTYILW